MAVLSGFYVYIKLYNFNFYYLVSKLGDNVKLGFKVKMINISF